jgi:hypothetical protein
MTIANISAPILAPSNSTCCSVPEKTSKWQKTVDMICRVAISIFAAIYAPLPFFVSLSIGAVGGATYAATRLYQKKTMFPDGESKPVCAQGYMDFLSGMRFPPLVGTLATATFIAAHIRHDPLFYAPFCGLFIGFWLGRDGLCYGRDLGNYAINRFQPKIAFVEEKKPCCCKA